MASLSLLVSQILVVLFVGTVALWYLAIPYFVTPSPLIVSHILSRTRLHSVVTSLDIPFGDNAVFVENWTKWRLYVNISSESGNYSSISPSQVIYGSSKDVTFIEKKAVINMEWRSEDTIVIERTTDEVGGLSVSVVSPRHLRSGVWDHFTCEVLEDGKTIRILPRFIFGLSLSTLKQIYAGEEVTDESVIARMVVENVPINSFFSVARMDRILVQAYMTLVTVSVILLLRSNNPPETLLKPSNAVVAVVAADTSFSS